MKNYYHVLGLPKDATPEQIKTAYRKLSLKFHPDKNDGEDYFSDMFKQVNEAYNTLYDATNRKQYDAKLYKFENPEPVVKTVYQQPQPAAPRPTNTTNYNTNYRPSIDKWQPVKKWEKRRNAMLVINGILIILIFIKSGVAQTNIKQTTTDSIVIKPKSHHKSHKAKQTITSENPLKQENKVDSVYKEPTAIIDSKEEISVTPTATALQPEKVDSSTKEELPKKKRGFFKRLFSKKVKDTIK